MIKKSIFLALLILIPLSSASLNVSSVNSTDYSPLEAGEKNYINFTAENNFKYPIETEFQLEISASENVNNTTESDFHTEIIDENGISSCDFNSTKNWVYVCPKDRKLLSPGTATDFKLVTTPAPNLIGSKKVNIELDSETFFGEVRNKTSFSSEENPSTDLGNLRIETSGSSVNGQAASYKSLVFDKATESKNLKLFATNFTGTDQVNMSFSFKENLIKNQFYTFEVYRYNQGWQEVEMEVSEQNLTASSIIEPEGFYSLNIQRERMSIEDLIERETEVEKSVDSQSASFRLEGLGEGEEVSLGLSEIQDLESFSLEGLSLVSNVNNTANVSVEIDSEGIEYSSYEEPDFTEEAYVYIDAPDMHLDKISYSISNDQFEYRENIGVFRNSGEEWNKIQNDFLIENVDRSEFEANPEGNSEFAIGFLEPNLLIQKISSPNKILDNETLEIEAKVINRGRGTGEKQLNLSINNESITDKILEVEGESEKSHIFKQNLESGNYTINVNSKQTKSEVKLRALKWRILDKLPFDDIRILYGLIASTIIIIALILLKLIGKNPIKILKIRRELKKSIKKLKQHHEGNNIQNESEKKERIEGEKDSVEEEKPETKESQGAEYQCDNCGKVLHSKEDYDLHMRNVHEINHSKDEGDYMCAVCGESFDTSKGLELHHTKFHE